MMKKSMVSLHLYLCQNRGATALEYGLLAAAVALAISGSVMMFGDAVYDVFYSDLPNVLNK